MNYKRIYDSIIERAKERVPEGYVERHHIIPRCVGGSDDRSNLVALTPEEHFLCHVLLVKIYPEKSGLIYAVNKMGCSSKNHKRPKRKLYGWLKRRYSEQRKLDSTGEGNTQFGTFWINKVGTLENKKVPVGSEIPEGWEKGRKLTLNTLKVSFCEICGTETKTNARHQRRFCDKHVRHNSTLAHVQSPLSKSVSVNGVVYISVAEAARVLGLEVETARRRFKSKNFKDWVYL